MAAKPPAQAASMVGHERCPDCGVRSGQLHEPGCDIERCPACGGQYISCDCTDEELRGLSRIPWKGEFPGVSDCREYGLYVRRIPGLPGWHPCSEVDPGAVEDLNSLMADYQWDRSEQRWRKPGDDNPGD